MHSPDLSIIILCYQAKEELIAFSKQIIQEAEQLGIEYELILIANYSKNLLDSTPEIARQVSEEYKNITVVTEEKEGGMGWDMKSGLEKAQGNYIAVIDGDGQMPASDIPLVYEIIKNGQYDLVKTYRAIRHDGIFRRLLSTIYNLIFRLLYNPAFPIRDVNSKPKIMTRAAYKQLHLKSNDWFTDAEIMIQALEHNFKICEVATVFYKNERRASFVGLRTILEFIYNLIKYRVRH